MEHCEMPGKGAGWGLVRKTEASEVPEKQWPEASSTRFQRKHDKFLHKNIHYWERKNNDTLRKIWTDSLKGSSLMSFIHRINNYLLSPCHVLGTVLGSATDKVPALTELQETDNQAVHQSQPGT